MPQSFSRGGVCEGVIVAVDRPLKRPSVSVERGIGEPSGAFGICGGKIAF